MERDKTFFKSIRQFEGKAGKFTFPTPIFYYDVSAFCAVYTASYSAVKKLMPSPRLKPYRFLLNRALVGFAAFSYQDTDIGPYNEFAVAVPVNLDKQVNIGGPSMLRGLVHPSVFVTHLPVTTEIALVAGKEIYNFPKFIADIDIEIGEDKIAAHLSEGDRDILDISIPVIRGKRAMKVGVNGLTCFEDRMLRCEIIGEGRDIGVSLNTKEVKINLGDDHFMAREIRNLELGKPLAAMYIPKAQAILTTPLDAENVVK